MRLRSRFLIDLGVLAENYRKLKLICPNNEVLFMVKADGYGHGATVITRFSVAELGIKEFGVATLGEAIALREEIKDLEFEIYVFSDIQLTLESAKEIYLNRRIIPVISNEGDLDYFLADPDFKHFPLVLKFNTGMNRLGLDFDKAELMAKKIKMANRHSIFHLLTHYSSASLSMKKNKRNLEQKDRFQLVKKVFRREGLELERTSIANSGAIEQGEGLEETHVRPGLMLYGPTSLIGPCRNLSRWTGQIISELETYIIRTFPVAQGMPIGYGATPVPVSGLVAIIALGYGDGLSTRYQGVHLFHNGQKGTIMGRVNMDMAQVFFAGEVGGRVKEGDRFVIWGHDSESFLLLADQSQTIPYEIFLHITSRVPKVYI